MLSTGEPAPEFTLPDQYGRPVSLSDFRGRWVLLWWYPAAQTPGCTIEGQNLRDRSADFAAADCVVLGASFDDTATNLAFSEMQGFEFPLLSDTDQMVGTEYQVVRHGDDHYGCFSERYSYLIDPRGVVRRAYAVSDVDVHADEVLADLARLSTTS